MAFYWLITAVVIGAVAGSFAFHPAKTSRGGAYRIGHDYLSRPVLGILIALAIAVPIAIIVALLITLWRWIERRS